MTIFCSSVPSADQVLLLSVFHSVLRKNQEELMVCSSSSKFFRSFFHKRATSLAEERLLRLGYDTSRSPNTSESYVGAFKN